MDTKSKIKSLCSIIEEEIGESRNLKRSIKEKILLALTEIVMVCDTTTEVLDRDQVNLFNITQIFKEEVTLLKEEWSSKNKDQIENLDQSNLFNNIKTIVKEEVSHLKEEWSSSYVKPSYAEAVVPKPLVRGPSLVLSTTSTNVNADILKTWKSSTSFRNKSYAPLSTKKISKNKILVEFENNEQKSEIIKILDSCPLLKAEEPLKLMPHLVLKGITRDIPKEELLEVIKNQNYAV